MTPIIVGNVLIRIRVVSYSHYFILSVCIVNSHSEYEREQSSLQSLLIHSDKKALQQQQEQRLIHI